MRSESPGLRSNTQTKDSRVNEWWDSLKTAFELVWLWDETLSEIVRRSLMVSLSATVLACSLGMGVGAWLGVHRSRLMLAILPVLNTLLALPSVVVGLVVYLLLSRTGPLGHLGWLFTFQAMVLAQTVLLLPLVIALTRQWVNQADQDFGEQLASWGAGPWVRSWLLAWEVRWSLLTVIITAFGRAVSEVGAVMIVGGNVDGFTRVMTTAIALETSKGDLPLALGLGLVLLTVVLALHLSLSWLIRHKALNAPIVAGASS